MNGKDKKAHKNSVRYLKANVNYVFCVINATINRLGEQFHCDQKILMFSSSVVCLSFTIENIFKNKKGTIKIVVYKSVIEINQIDDCIKYNEGCFTNRFHIKKAFAAYLLENAILVLF